MKNKNKLYTNFRSLKYKKFKLPILRIDIWGFCPRTGEIMDKYLINYKR